MRRISGAGVAFMAVAFAATGGCRGHTSEDAGKRSTPGTGGDAAVVAGAGGSTGGSTDPGGGPVGLAGESGSAAAGVAGLIGAGSGGVSGGSGGVSGGAGAGGVSGGSGGVSGGSGGVAGGVGGATGTAGVATGGGSGGAEVDCGSLGQACCADDRCYSPITSVCSPDGRCVACGAQDEPCCLDLGRPLRPWEQAGKLCRETYNACSSEGLCVRCGAEHQPCCATNTCWTGPLGCCVGGICIADGASCGEGNGTCSAGACTDCGSADGERCCDGSCGLYLLCDANDTCVCGGEGELCCDGSCDEGLGCYGGGCEAAVTKCPSVKPSDGASCNFILDDACTYLWGTLQNDCFCTDSGWYCIEHPQSV